jgi:hypothetical protein
MNEYRQQYLTAMTNKVCEMMSKTELSAQDIDFIMLYKTELKRAEFVPTIKRILNGAEEVLAFIKKIGYSNSVIPTVDDTEVENQTENNVIEENVDNGNDL